MTKTTLILSIIPILAVDVLFSVWYVRNFQPQNDNWKIPVWIISAILVFGLCYFTSVSITGSNSIWWSVLLVLPIPFAYSILKNMALGLIWHSNIFYMGKKGFDAWVLQYTQNPTLHLITLGIITLVLSGLWNYVSPKYKQNEYNDDII